MILMKTLLGSCAVGVSLVLFSGCGYSRVTAYVDEPCCALNIATTNKYTLKDMCTDYLGELKTDPNFADVKRMCCLYYPGVFSSSDDGVPVVAKVRLKNMCMDGKLLWAIGFSIWNLGMVLPVFEHGFESVVAYDVIVPDAINSESFKLRSSYDTTFCNSPLGYLYRVFPQGNSIPEECRIFEEVDRISFSRRKNSATEINNRAVAYGLAVGLKKMEMAGKIPPDIAERVERRKAYDRKSSDERKDLFADLPQSGAPAESDSQLYSLQSLKMEDGMDFAYRFELSVAEEALQLPRVNNLIKNDFRKMILGDYNRRYPNADSSNLYVDFPEFHLGPKTTGRVVVLSFRLISVVYDANTRKGKISAFIVPNQYKEIREWMRRNIEELALYKNIALTTDKPPPAATYYLLGEKVEGNVMEIEFKTE